MAAEEEAVRLKRRAGYAAAVADIDKIAPVVARDGTWTFDGESVRVVPGDDRRVHPLRRALGEVRVPLEVLADITFEEGVHHGRLRMRLRPGADPLLHATGGQLDIMANPYWMRIGREAFKAARAFVTTVGEALPWQDGPCHRYYLAGPRVPLTAEAYDGTGTFDGTVIRLEWNWLTEEKKKSSGPATLHLEHMTGVDWHPPGEWLTGSLRFRIGGDVVKKSARHDRRCLVVGLSAKEKAATALLAAAVVARLPHPFGPQDARPADRARPW